MRNLVAYLTENFYKNTGSDTISILNNAICRDGDYTDAVKFILDKGKYYVCVPSPYGYTNKNTCDERGIIPVLIPTQRIKGLLNAAHEGRDIRISTICINGGEYKCGVGVRDLKNPQKYSYPIYYPIPNPYEDVKEGFFNNVGSSWKSLFAKVLHKKSTNQFWADSYNKNYWWIVEDHFLRVFASGNTCGFDLNRGSMWMKLFEVYKPEELGIWIEPMYGTVQMGLYHIKNPEKEFVLRFVFPKSMKSVELLEMKRYEKLGYTEKYYHSKGSMSGTLASDAITNNLLIEEITGFDEN